MSTLPVAVSQFWQQAIRSECKHILEFISTGSHAISLFHSSFTTYAACAIGRVKWLSDCGAAVIEAHARDELGIDTDDMANPWLACITSAISFSIGAAIPLLSSAFISDHFTRCTLPRVTSCRGGPGAETLCKRTYRPMPLPYWESRWCRPPC